MPILIYKCKHCGRSFDKREGAVFCENSHLEIKSAKVTEYCFSGPYPLYVEIEFKNGAKEKYMLEKESWFK